MEPNEMINVEPNQQVYVIERNDNYVKIGVSTNIKLRRRTLETQGGFVATRFFSGEKLSNGYQVERRVHEKLSAFRRIGEWFDIAFKDAVATVIKTEKEIGEKNTKRTNKVKIIYQFSTAMEDLETLDPAMYKWLILNNFEVEYTDHGIEVYGDFGDGFREKMSYGLFRSITYAIWDGRAI